MSQFPASTGRRPYSFADHASTNDDFGGSMVFRPESGVSLRGPAYGDGNTTTVRFSPCRGADGRPTPYRQSSAPNHLGDWIRAYYAMRNVGEPRVTFLVHDPSDGTTDREVTPGAVLENSISTAIKNGQDRGGWARLTTYIPGKGKALSRPARLYLAFGTIWKHKNKLYQPPMGFAADNPPICIGMSKQCGDSFLALCNAVNPQYSGPDGPWEQQMANGDIISFDSGRFITFYTLKDGDPRNRQAQQSSGWTTGASNSGSQDVIGFGCYAETTFNGQPAAVPEGHREYLLGKTRPWDEILWFPTIAEQAEILAARFPPDVIMYGWRNHPEWIPESVKRAAVGAHSVNVGQGWSPGPPAGAPAWPASPQYPAAQPPYPGQYGVPPQAPAMGTPPGYGAPQQPSPYPQPAIPPGGDAGGWGNPYQQPVTPPAAPVTDPAMPRGGIPGLPSALQPPPAVPGIPPASAGLPPAPPPGWGASPNAPVPAAAPGWGAPSPAAPAPTWVPPSQGPSPAPVQPVPVPTAPVVPPVIAPAPQGIAQPPDGFMPAGQTGLPPQPPPPLPGNFPAGRGGVAAALAAAAKQPGQS